MNVETILQLVKGSLGMNNTFRDAYLTNLIQGIIDELTKEKGITIDPADSNHLMFIVDYAAWRFTSKDDPEMPKHLKWRLKNLYIRSGGGGSDVQA